MTVRPDVAARGRMLDALDAWERAAVAHGRALEQQRGTARTLEDVRMTRRTVVATIYRIFGWEDEA